MAKSSLKKWLKSKQTSRPDACIYGSKWISDITDHKDSTFHDADSGEDWFIDVLGDGTAITYCANKV